MAKFNLTFRGKILEGHDRKQVETRLAELFAIHDPARLRQCFSGDVVVLSRDLNRKQAAESYARLRRLGMETELVKLDERNGARDSKPPATNAPTEAKSSATEQARQKALAREAAQQAKQEAAREALLREQQAQRRAMEQQAERRAAQELTHISPASAAGRVKTRLELPSRKRAYEADAYPGRRKRQPGEPNLFSLSPFRNTAEVRGRAQVARRRCRCNLVAAAVSMTGVLAMLLGMRSLQTDDFTGAASAVAVGPGQGPLLLAADRLLLHDRAGVGQSVLGAQQLGIVALWPPLAFDPQGRLLAPGRLASTTADKQAPALLRCTLEEPYCDLFSEALAGSTISALAVDPLDGSVFVADSEAGELLKLNAQGELLARAIVQLPEQPVLRLDAGLLLVNGAQGPSIAVLRLEDAALGEQLDEILPQPSPDAAARYRGISDFLPLGDQWWVLLERRDDRPAELFRFDRQWQSLGKVHLSSGGVVKQLAAWGKRLLVRQSGDIPLQKFNEQGAAEAPLVSTLLTTLVAEQTRRASLELLAWRAGLALAMLALVASCCLASLYHIRCQVYSSSRVQGAVPLGGADDISWVAPAANRQQRLSLLGRAHAVLALAAIMVAVGLGVSALQLAALLVALAGPGFALLLQQGSGCGHIGTRGDVLVLADHQGVYHLGSGSRIHYRSHFLMIDDVTVFIGSRLLPAFDPTAIIAQVVPLARRGIHVDRKFLATRLLQGRHPLALGTGIILACACGALALLSLSGMG